MSTEPSVFTIPSQELYDKLTAIQFGATTAEITTQSDCVIFQGGQMYTFDGQIFCCIAQTFPKDCAVPFKMIKDAIGKPSKSANVEIEPGENSLILRRRGARTMAETTIPYKAEILHQVQAIPVLTEADVFHPFPAEIAENIQTLESVIDISQRGTVLFYIHYTPQYVEAANTEHIVRITTTPTAPYPATFLKHALIPAGYLGKIQALSSIQSFTFKGNWMYIKTEACNRYAFPVITDTEYIDAATLQGSLYPTDKGIPLILPPELAEEVITGLKFSDDGVAHIVINASTGDTQEGTLELLMHNAVSAHKATIKCDIVATELKSTKIAIHGAIIAKIAKGATPSVTIYENAVIGEVGKVRYAVSTLTT